MTGNSTGQEQYVVVSFSGPTNAQLGGFWGLGFGLIDPARLRHPAKPATDSVELRRIELLTSSMPWKRSTN